MPETTPPNTADAYTLVSLVNLDDPVIFQELIGIEPGAGPVTRLLAQKGLSNARSKIVPASGPRRPLPQ